MSLALQLGSLALPLFAVASAAPAAPAVPPSAACELADGLLAHDMAGALVDLPFRTVDGRIYLDVTVNGTGPFVFALDTGASGLGRADMSLVTMLSLPAAGESETSDGVATASVDTVTIASLALGGLVHSDVTVIARDYRSRVSEAAAFSGILGRAFFADGLLAIDFPKKRLRYFADQRLPADIAGALAYERAFRLPVRVGNIAFTANMDTGADVSMLMPLAVYAQIASAPLEPAGNVSLTNSRLPSFVGQIAGPVRLGDARLNDIPVRVAEGYPEVLIGAHALRDQRVLIDQRSSAVAICPAGSA